jgi:archaellum component FlaC
MSDQHDTLDFTRGRVDDELSEEIVALEERHRKLIEAHVEVLTHQISELHREIENMKRSARPLLGP